MQKATAPVPPPKEITNPSRGYPDFQCKEDPTAEYIASVEAGTGPELVVNEFCEAKERFRVIGGMLTNIFVSFHFAVFEFEVYSIFFCKIETVFSFNIALSLSIDKERGYNTIVIVTFRLFRPGFPRTWTAREGKYC